MRASEFFHAKFGFAARLFPNIACELADDLDKARMREAPEEWLALGFGCALVASIAVLPLALFWEWAFFFSFAAFVSVFVFFIRHPSARAKGIGRRTEKELPSALRAFAIEFSANRPFEECLRSVAKMGGAVGSDFRNILRNIEAGAAPVDATAAWARRTRSSFVSRAAGLLAIAYQKGPGTTQGMRALAAEISAVERARMKAYGGRLAMWSLFFIAVSVVAPAILQVFMTIGPLFLHMSFSPAVAFLVPAALFPAACCALVYAARAMMP
jgi:pilus assembly protein TadC